MNPSSPAKSQSVCLVHDWLVAMRGGEKVLENFCLLFPDAPIYTLFAAPEKLSPLLKSKKIHTSFLQWIPGVQKFYRWLLPLFPLAISSFNLKQYDLVISSSHCVAKAAKTRKDAVHICYCHTPMRYLWGFEKDYFGHFPGWIRSLINVFFSWLKKWDVKTSNLVTEFIANSKNTADKIKHLYGKDAEVICPPIETPKSNLEIKVGHYYLIVSALVPYKRIDLAIDAFNHSGHPLKIVGDGPLYQKLTEQIHGQNIQFEGWVGEEALWNYYAGCKALLMPGEEDFGIVPLEAQMCGKPVIAYGKGGALETVLGFGHDHSTKPEAESTGIFFYEQNSESLRQTIQKFERLKFNPSFIQAHAMRFAASEFRRKIASFLARHAR